MKSEADADMEPNVVQFLDNFQVPDCTHDYTSELRDNATPLVIDNGSYKCSAGWATDKSPRLSFKNLIAKQRSKKTPQETLETKVGNDIGNLEVARWQLKSHFDRDIVTQYDAQEQIFDYIFSHLGLGSVSSVDHPLVLTEAVCNPNYCRHKMSELLFECYHVPSVAYGVDSLFSLYNNHPNPASATSLVVSCGYNTTHVLPVLNGRLDPGGARRINIGGSQMTYFLQRILQLKYPGHISHLTQSRAEEILHTHCRMAASYQSQLSQWADEDYYCTNVHKYQLPFSQGASGMLLVEQQKERREQQKEKREQQVKRIKAINAKKREEQLREEQEKMSELLTMNEMYEDEDDDTFQRALEQYGITSPEDLQETIVKLSTSIQRLRYKILMEEIETKPIGSDLLSVPDEMLTPDQQERKRRQKLYKSIGGDAHARNIAKMEKKSDLSEFLPEDPSAMDEWLAGLRKQRQSLLDVRAGRKQRKQDMTKRRTHASQQRMKIITELARGSRKKKEDTFGANDDDWNVYKEINTEAGDSDSEAEQEKIEEIETLLREYDPNFKDPNEVDLEMDMKEYYRIHVGVEKIRIPELMFQPSMIGHDQAGLSETLEFVLSKYKPEQQNALCQHVFLTGGCASFPNLKERLEIDLAEMRPFQSTFQVYKAEDPIHDAWNGARKWALEPGFLASSVTRADYEEMGGEYLKEHFASNVFTPSPIPHAKFSPVKVVQDVAIVDTEGT